MNAIDVARSALPLWVVWTPMLLRVGVALLLTGAVALFIGGLAAGAVSRIDPRLHWTERARLGLAWRASVGTQPLVIGLVAAFLAFWVGPIARPPSPLVALAIVFATVAITTPVRVLVERRVRDLSGTFGAQVWQTLVFGFVRVPHVWTLIVLGFVAPTKLDSLAWGIFALAVGVMLSASTGLYLAPARALGFIRPAGERLQRLVGEAAARTGTTPKEVLELRVSVANALAYPTTGVVAFTTAAIDALDDAQIVAVAAHELGHLAEPLSQRAWRATTPLALAPLVLIRPLLGSQLFEGIALMFVVVVGWLMLFRWAVRHNEKRADAVAHRAETEPGVYASALETLYRVNMAPAVMRTRRTAHPHLYDRLVAAGVTPSYPRPAFPPTLPMWARLPYTGAFLALVFCTVGLAPGTHFIPVVDARTATVMIGLNGGDRTTFEVLAEDATARGAVRQARAFERLAEASHF